MCGRLAAALVVIVTLCLGACGPSEWEKAKSADTIEALEAFVRSNPTSEFKDAATARIGELIWNDATASNTRESFERYLSAYADGPNAKEAQTRIGEIRWDEAVAVNTIEGFTNFLRAGASDVQIDAARDAVKSLQPDALAERPAVEISGIFSGGIVKYVDHIGVRYEGEIAGLPARVAYVVSAGSDSDGKQQYFVYQDGDAVLALKANPSVAGTIELQTPADGAISYELFGLLKGASDDLVGSYLVAKAKGPNQLWSRVEGLALAKTAHNVPGSVLSAGEAILFAVHDNFRLLYVP